MFKEYKSKPKIIKAIKVDFSSKMFNALDFINEMAKKQLFIICESTKTVTVKTLEGDMICHEGDYIIKGIEDEYYPCKSTVFHKSYEILD